MTDFVEPDILLDLPERQGRDGSRERLRLETSQFKGKPTFALRIVFQTASGEWRWSQAKPTASGKSWAAVTVRRDELKALGEALLRAAALGTGGQQQPQGDPRLGKPTGEARRPPSAREQKELDRFDRAHGQRQI